MARPSPFHLHPDGPAKLSRLKDGGEFPVERGVAQLGCAVSAHRQCQGNYSHTSDRIADRVRTKGAALIGERAVRVDPQLEIDVRRVSSSTIDRNQLERIISVNIEGRARTRNTCAAIDELVVAVQENVASIVTVGGGPANFVRDFVIEKVPSGLRTRLTVVLPWPDPVTSEASSGQTDFRTVH